MHALVGLLLAAGWPHARAHFTHDEVDHALSLVFGDKTTKWPHHRMLDCAQTVGPATCLGAFGVFRAERALHDGAHEFDEDLEKFPWEKYANVSEDGLNDQLTDSTARLLQRRPLTLNGIPGYRLELDSRTNGALSVDIYRSKDESEARGAMKKLRKRFLTYLPLFLLPGLLMSAVLPFILPALKFATIGAVMLNNMALTGAVFTLLRNNAFNTNYQKKIVYVNAGYKNGKKPIGIPVGESDVIHTHTIESEGYFLEPVQDGYEYAGSDGSVRVEGNQVSNSEEGQGEQTRRGSAKEKPHPFEGFAHHIDIPHFESQEAYS